MKYTLLTSLAALSFFAIACGDDTSLSGGANGSDALGPEFGVCVQNCIDEISELGDYIEGETEQYCSDIQCAQPTDQSDLGTGNAAAPDTYWCVEDCLQHWTPEDDVDCYEMCDVEDSQRANNDLK